MKCAKCGEELKQGNRFCTNCGTSIVPGTPVNTLNYATAASYGQNKVVNVVAEDENKKANRLCVYSLLCYFVGPIIFAILSVLLNLIFQGLGTFLSLGSTISKIAAYVFIGMARVKYPRNTFSKVLMWVYIALFLLGLLLAIVIVVILVFALFSWSYN